MTEFLLQVVREAWAILREASFFLLLGFVLAGVFAVLVPRTLIMRSVRPSTWIVGRTTEKGLISTISLPRCIRPMLASGFSVPSVNALRSTRTGEWGGHPM